MQQTSIVHSGSVQFKTERIVDMRLIGPAFAFVALFGVGGGWRVCEIPFNFVLL